MLIESQSFDQQSDRVLQLDEARWQHYVALKQFFTELTLPMELGAVYAQFKADHELNPVVELKVVDHFPDHLAKSAYRIIHNHLGDAHPFLSCIESPEGI